MRRLLPILTGALCASTALANPFEMPGTQPGELTLQLAHPNNCGNCHGGYAGYASFDTWAGSMMANAQRDPLYLAALTIADQDIPGSGEFCIRCHAPRGWLHGRSTPTDGSALIPDDIEGVTCDFCHRMVPGPDGERLISNGQFYVANDYIARGTFPTTHAPHGVEVADYHASSELCGACHDVTNPLNDVPLERTYSEWLLSDYSKEGVGCVDCHMEARTGYAANANGLPQRTVHRHVLAGGNTFIPKVLQGEYPELGREAAFQLTIEAAEAQLKKAAELSIHPMTPMYRGGPVTVGVRVENLTGHKLPTGYPEGRRSWLEVRILDGSGTQLLHSGIYDYDEADRIDDEQLRTYEVTMGQDGVRGFHFLEDELLADNRIPPRGLVPNDSVFTLGRDYSQDGTDVLRHWDEAPYEIELAPDAPGPLRVEATLWYQTTSRPYVEWLRDNNFTDDSGDYLYEVWAAYGRSEPVEMASIVVNVPVEDPPPPDVEEPEEAPEVEAKGCGCATGGPAVGWLLIPAAGLVVLRRRRLR